MSDPSGLRVHPRAAPRRLRQWPFGLVLLGVAGGLAVQTLGRVRLGTALVAAAVLLGALLRATLPARTAGLLVVRSRWLDVAALTVLGAGLAVIGVVVPPPS